MPPALRNQERIVSNLASWACQKRESFCAVPAKTIFMQQICAGMSGGSLAPATRDDNGPISNVIDAAVSLVGSPGNGKALTLRDQASITAAPIPTRRGRHRS
ncbi:MAG: hypothetical protein LCH61_05950 [Proteobacteria bacterium]|nr:hypothetical protein [Pseudomonadota bacterium]